MKGSDTMLNSAFGLHIMDSDERLTEIKSNVSAIYSIASTRAEGLAEVQEYLDDYPLDRLCTFDLDNLRFWLDENFEGEIYV
jgi:hypothetical protein